MRKFLFFIGVSSATLGQACQAQVAGDGEVVLLERRMPEEIVVTSNGWESWIGDTGLPVTILAPTAGGTSDIVTLLQQAPGVTLSRNGGAGSFTALRLRGSEAEQILVVVDGVRLADAASPGGGFDFGTLLPAGVGKAEILRGPNSVVWGSQAIAGVVAVESSEIDGVTAALSYGGENEFDGQAAAGLVRDKYSIAINAGFHDEDGISAAGGGTEADGFRQWQAGGKARVQLTDRLSVKGGLRHADARLELDGFPAPDYILADTAEYQLTQQTSARAGLDYEDGGLRLFADWSLADTHRETFDPSYPGGPSFESFGRSQIAQLRGQMPVLEGVVLRSGVEREWSRYETLFDAPHGTGLSAGYGQLGVERGVVSANVGVRLTDHDTFGSNWSFGADGVVRLGAVHLKASYGEGFKAPSLYQLHSDYGNLALRSETSRSFDIGLSASFDHGASIGASLFRRGSSDLIAYVSCFGVVTGICSGRPYGTYDNIGKARAQGFEVEGKFRPLANFELAANYSYVEASNRTAAHPDFGKDLARRPRHAANLSANWWLAEDALQIGADVRIVSHSYDDAANSVRMDGYATMNVRVAYDLTDNWQVFARVENLWDEDYATAAGYGTPGRGVFAGVTTAW